MTIGNVLALLGWLSFAVAILLAARSPWLARSVGGLSRQHRLHHYVGLLVAACLSVHAGHELWLDADTSLDFTDPFLVAGWIGLVLLLLALGFSLTGLPYRSWIRIHRLFLAALLLGALHAQAFVQPAMPHPLALHAGNALAVLGLGALGLCMLRHRPWSVVAVRRIDADLFEIEIGPVKGSAQAFAAGAVVLVRFRGPYTRMWHPFSVASCRCSPTMRLLVKNVGRDTGHLAELKPGDRVDLQGPFAEFRASPEVEQVWVAGGVGIAPFLGMMRCLEFEPRSRVALAVFSTTDEPQLIVELSDFAQRYPNFSWHYYVNESLPDFTPLNELGRQLHEPVYLVCGPPIFMKRVRKYLRRQGVPGGRIETEEFNPW